AGKRQHPGNRRPKETSDRGELFDRRIQLAADSALMIGGVYLAVGSAEEGTLSGAPVGCGSGGQLIVGGRAQIAPTHDDVTERVAVLFARGETGINPTGSVWRGAARRRWSQLWEGFREAGVGAAKGLDGISERLEFGNGGPRVFADFGGVPFNFEGGQIQEHEAEGKQLPLPAFADESHLDVHGRAGGVGGIPQVNGNEREIVLLVGAAELDFSGTDGRLTRDDRTSAWVHGRFRLASVIEQNQALHQADPRGVGHARE